MVTPVLSFAAEEVAAFKEGTDVSFQRVRAEGEAILLSVSLAQRLPDP